ncbi:SDR family NAD(P)-dependent oxidoreductase [Paenibacillus sp. OV219]|uniref:SDR family NAD(P)-dependent oxidoreductase n=1 Tax=Paenibacillus sp. OV219 TaxID=1884377 RepID=UPI0008B1CE49|nr:SDR family oxidoreductase [Paenibacillus sp. OV219]SEN79402.1 glucose 1-dehydrogenase [Paenibacillus sp. OV219]
MERKVALVTGSGRGIGKGIAHAFANAGYDVCVNYNKSAKQAEEVVQQLRGLGVKAEAVQANIADLDNVASLIEQVESRFGRLDVLVNNSGITRMKPFLETSPELFDEVVHTDFRGLYFCSQHAARLMVKQGTQGVIIHISSNHAEGNWANSTVYAASKAAVNKLAKNMALDLAPHGIRVVGIAPGYTKNSWADGSERVQKMIENISSRIPMGRFCTPQEVGEAAVFLASGSAGYMTGTTIYMDGGALLPVWAEKGNNG